MIISIILLSLLILLIIIGVVIIAIKYRTLLNPFTPYSALFLVKSGVGPLIYIISGVKIADIKAVNYTALMSILFFVFLLISVLFKNPVILLFDRLLSNLSRVTNSRKSYIKSKFQKIYNEISVINKTGYFINKKLLFITILPFLFWFLVLMIKSGVSTMWLTDPRQAYQFHRTSVGVFWSLSEASLFFSFIVMLIGIKPKLIQSILITFLYIGGAFFLGSKGIMLLYIVVLLFYIHYYIRIIRSYILVLAGVFTFVLFLLLQIIQGTSGSIYKSFLYFDYFNNTATFIERFNDFHFYLGKGLLSNLWLYIPRALYPDKPFEYGSGLIASKLFPGAAAAGHTPGFLDWSVLYLDFGFVGVVLYGYLFGTIIRYIFENFMKNKTIFAFLLLIQYGLMEFFVNAPFPIFLCWIFLQFLFLRITKVFN